MNLFDINIASVILILIGFISFYVFKKISPNASIKKVLLISPVVSGCLVLIISIFFSRTDFIRGQSMTETYAILDLIAMFCSMWIFLFIYITFGKTIAFTFNEVLRKVKGHSKNCEKNTINSKPHSNRILMANILYIGLLGIGGWMLITPYLLYKWIYYGYEQYIWIINGPFPYSHMGGLVVAPVSLLILLGGAGFIISAGEVRKIIINKETFKVKTLKQKIINFISAVILGMGSWLMFSPVLFTWWLHGNYKRYLWIISGPAPYSHMGGGVDQLLIWIILFSSGVGLVLVSMIVKKIMYKIVNNNK